MISKRIKSRKDGKSSAGDALRYGEGLAVDKETGEILDKSHRTRLGNFGIVDDGVYEGLGPDVMSAIIKNASIEMQANCDQNTRVGVDKRIAHFVISFNQEKPSEAALLDTEDSMLSAMGLGDNHFASFLHNDNGHWHMHIFASRIGKEKPHRGNPLWQDQIKRDKVCREIEARHGLQADNGMHQYNELGELVEIPRAERQRLRAQKPVGISDRAKTKEIYTGETSFQTWCNEIRIGDRLKHAKSWADLHTKAAAYGCEVKPKGAGFVICPLGQSGAIQLSKVGLKNLPAVFGAFQPAQSSHQAPAEHTYKPGPSADVGKDHYTAWRAKKAAFNPMRVDRINEQRDAHAKIRQDLKALHQSELAQIRKHPGLDRFAATSVAKMSHAVALSDLKQSFAEQRQVLRTELAKASPGNTFRDYLVQEATKGDTVALGLARRYGVQEATDVLCIREASRLGMVAAVHGEAYHPAPRLSFSHQVERNGTVVYDFGGGRKVTDSAIAKQVQLNDAAAHSPQAIATALTFATTKFGNTLTLTGTAAFQRLAVETAVRNRLGIRFADPALETLRAQLENQFRSTSRAGHAVDFSHLTPQQIREGAERVINQVPRPPEHVLRAQEREQRAETDRASGVHELPGRNLDGDRHVAELPLPDLVQNNLVHGASREDPAMRHSGAGQSRSGDASGRTEEAPKENQRGISLSLVAEAVAQKGITKPVHQADAMEWTQHTGTIIAVVPGHVAVEESDRVTVHAIDRLRITSSGTVHGIDAIAPGNDVSLLYKTERDGQIHAKTTITENRKEHQQLQNKGIDR